MVLFFPSLGSVQQDLLLVMTSYCHQQWVISNGNTVARFCHLLNPEYRFHWRTLVHHCKSLNYISSAADYVMKSPCKKCVYGLVLLLCVSYERLGPSFLLFQLVAGPMFSSLSFVKWCGICVLVNSQFLPPQSLAHCVSDNIVLLAEAWCIVF